VEKSNAVTIDEDEDIIIIDDEGDLSSKGSDGVALEPFMKATKDIILLDEKDEEIVIDNVDRDTIIIDEDERPPRHKGKKKDVDDEFLIIEDDK